jgi:site-specific recombinase XerD
LIHGCKERLVYLGRAAEHGLLSYKTFVRLGTYTDRFFVTTRGQPMTAETVAHALTRVAERSGVERLHAHLLRHTAATQYLVAGGDAISLQQKLGHTTLTMTSRYVHLASEHLAAIRERVSPMDKMRIKPLNRPYRRGNR